MDTKTEVKDKKREKKELFEKKYKFRMKVLVVLFLIATVVLVGRLGELMLVHAQYLQMKSEDMRKLKLSSLHTYRGDVTDRNGIILASDVTLFNVYTHPNYYNKWTEENPEKIATLLSPYLHEPVEELTKKFKMKEPSTISLAKKIDRKTILELKSMIKKFQRENKCKIKGLDFEKINERRYPQGTLAAHILGYIHSEANIVTGVQRTAMNELINIPEMPVIEDRYVDGKVVKFTDLEITGEGRLIYDKGTKVDKVVQPPKGKEVVLTIDAKLQYLCESELEKMINERKAKRGLAIMMNPRNGEILAFAVYPGYDPNQFRDYDTQTLKNWPIMDLYPPGSTFKVLTVALGLETGAITEFTKINDTGKMKVQGWTIRNYDYFSKGAPGVIDLNYLFVHSSNIASAKIALMMNPSLHRKYLEKLGIGNKTGIDLPGETAGYLLPLDDWKESTRATIGYGYGIATTPIQVLAAVGAIANEGVWVTPHIVKEPCVLVNKNIKKRRVLKETTARTVSRLLKNSISSGNAIAGKIPKYYVAGKTGTSLKLNEANPSKGYSKDIYTSFVGYLPADDPEIIVLVVVDSPQGYAAWGNTVAGPVFNAIASEAARYLNIKPDKPDEGKDKETNISIIKHDYIDTEQH